MILLEATRHDRLTAAEEATLASAIRGGDREAHGRLVMGNLRLVLYLARRYERKGVDFEHLVSEGLLGLCVAARKFEAGRGARFGTLAYLIVRHHILRALIDGAGAYRIPSHVARLVRRVAAVEKDWVGRRGLPPEDQEIARELGVSVRRVRQCRGQHAAALSLDAPVGVEESPLVDRLADDTGRTAADVLEQKDTIASLQGHVRDMPPRQRTLIECRFGLGGREPHSLREIGQLLGLTKERVRQLEELSLVQLRRAMAA